MDTDRDFPVQMNVISSVKHEEYILGDHTPLPIPLVQLPNLPMKIKSEPEDLVLDLVSVDKLSTEKVTAHVKTEPETAFELESPTVKEDLGGGDRLSTEEATAHVKTEPGVEVELKSPSFKVEPKCEELDIKEDLIRFVTKNENKGDEANNTDDSVSNKVVKVPLKCKLNSSSSLCKKTGKTDCFKKCNGKAKANRKKPVNSEKSTNFETSKPNKEKNSRNTIKHYFNTLNRTLEKDKQLVLEKNNDISKKRNKKEAKTSRLKTSILVSPNKSIPQPTLPTCTKEKDVALSALDRWRQRKMLESGNVRDCSQVKHSGKNNSNSEMNLSPVSRNDFEERQFVCKECCRGFKTQYLLDDHIFFKHNSSAPSYKCTRCWICFASQEELDRHSKWVHPKEKVQLPASCDICHKVYKSRSVMTSHKLRIHNTLNKEFICYHCSAVYTERNQFVIHIKKSHMPPELKCSICNEMFCVVVELKTHLRQKHGQDNRKLYVCETCGKTATNKTALQFHINSHSDKKPYVCGECGKGFKTESNLKQHKATHSNVRRFNCGLCDKAFRIRHHLRQHMAVHGMKSVPDYNKRARKRKKPSSESEDDDDE